MFLPEHVVGQKAKAIWMVIFWSERHHDRWHG
jgi:hypothetical protein